jgi:acyl-coenzyme A thioesterase PaaI-like protein
MYNAIGMIHGGVLCALLDSAASFALLSTLPEGKGLASWRSR